MFFNRIQDQLEINQEQPAIMRKLRGATHLELFAESMVANTRCSKGDASYFCITTVLLAQASYMAHIDCMLWFDGVAVPSQLRSSSRLGGLSYIKACKESSIGGSVLS